MALAWVHVSGVVVVGGMIRIDVSGYEDGYEKAMAFAFGMVMAVEFGKERRVNEGMNWWIADGEVIAVRCWT